MTFQEAIDKIIPKILETHDGWKLESKIFSKTVVTTYSNPSLEPLRIRREGLYPDNVTELIFNSFTVRVPTPHSEKICDHITASLAREEDKRMGEESKQIIAFAETL